MLVVVILDVFPYTGQTQSDVADITVLLYHGSFTEVTLDEVLTTAAGVHGISLYILQYREYENVIMQQTVSPN
jgi:hypothetical protein